MPDIDIGSVWAVPQLDAKVVISAGPFGGPERSEFLVTPLYPPSTPEFCQSHLDVRIGITEGPFDTDVFAGVWNTLPMLVSDLGLKLGVLSTAASEAVRDVYWASINDKHLSTDQRLGRFQWLRRGRILRFQENELARWRPLSARVWEENTEDSRALEPASSEGAFAKCWDQFRKISARVESETRVAGQWLEVPPETLAMPVDDARMVTDTTDVILQGLHFEICGESEVCFYFRPVFAHNIIDSETVFSSNLVGGRTAMIHVPTTLDDATPFAPSSAAAALAFAA